MISFVFHVVKKILKIPDDDRIKPRSKRVVYTALNLVLLSVYNTPNYNLTTIRTKIDRILNLLLSIIE